VYLDSPELSERDWPDILAPDEIARASRFYFEDDRRRFVKCRVALRILLGGYLEIQPADIRFQYENNGKPEIALPHDSRGLRFSVSNSGALASSAVGSGSAIGVDIEKVRPNPDFLNVARQFFSAREVQAILALSENKRQEAFFACWTRKEAFLKATGIGLSYPLSEFSVSVDPDGPAELWEVKGNRDITSHWFLTDVLPGVCVITRGCRRAEKVGEEAHDEISALRTESSLVVAAQREGCAGSRSLVFFCASGGGETGPERIREGLR
jgi:4'-phosphopantetheinyl transferase